MYLKATHCWSAKSLKWLEGSPNRTLELFQGKTFLHAHLNRTINKYDLGYVLHWRTRSRWTSNGIELYLDGSYTGIESKHPTKWRRFQTLLCKIFSFPEERVSRGAWNTRSIHEGENLVMLFSRCRGCITPRDDCYSYRWRWRENRSIGGWLVVKSSWTQSTMVLSFQSSTSTGGRSTTQPSSSAKQTKNWPPLSLKVWLETNSVNVTVLRRPRSCPRFVRWKLTKH